ncbi:hypothetical protein IRJ41_019988 [Triplophysa rosa]|uniref:Ig-like domain-containing protein n=1 Tax=Triplophysa rosa TaxID=992332 RepID=A0A9W7W8K6_TRIRA|nr:hypothetical protein IRJ41_019988 [Triplophysa rosa]
MAVMFSSGLTKVYVSFCNGPAYVKLFQFLQSKTMNVRLSSLILLLHIQGSLTLGSFSVTATKKNICAVRGAQVTLRCSYTDINIKTVFWFNKKQSKNWRESDEPEDIALDFDYSGRVKQQITNYQSDLTIRDVRERDSGEYQLMFIMKDGVKHISSVTVNLTVTVLQVKMILESTGQQVKLICDSSCKLTSGSYYNWYKNGQKLNYYTSNILMSSRGNADSYSCSESRENNPSTSVCVSNSGCWDVTYTSRRVCALVGSTVDIHSSYSHPTGYTVVNTYWHLSNLRLRDLREEQQFAGHVDYVRNALRIKDVNMSDSGEYQFRIITNTSAGKYSGSPGVSLTVTDTQVTSSPDPVVEGENVILHCSTKCTLDNKHTYIWYKNGTQVTEGFTLFNKLYLNSASREEIQQYSCAVTQISVPQKLTWLRSIMVTLSVFLTLALIGVLWYRIRKYTLSKNQEDAKMEAQYESVYSNAAPSEPSHKEENYENQDIHYSSINFGDFKTKHASAETTDTTEKEDVQYAAVMFS